MGLPVAREVSWTTFAEAGRDIRSELHLPDPDDALGVADYGFPGYRLWVTEDEAGKARIAAFVTKQHEEGFLGWFECSGSFDHTRSCLNASLEWLGAQGVLQAVGPMNGLTWDSYRFTLHNSVLFMGEPQHPSFYPEHWERYGFRVGERYFSRILAADPITPCTQEDLQAQLVEHSARLEPVNRDLYERHAAGLHKLLNQAFTRIKNPYFVPISYEAFRARFDPLVDRLPEGFTYLIFNEQEQPIAILLTYPAQFDTDERDWALVTKTIAIDPGLQKLKLGSRLIRYATWLAQQNGLPYQVLAMMHEDNPSMFFLNKHEPKQIRQYVLMNFDLK